MLSSPDWWNDIPSAVAFDVVKVSPHQAWFYIKEGQALAEAMRQFGHAPLPPELNTDQTLMTLGWFGYHWLYKKSELN